MFYCLFVCLMVCEVVGWLGCYVCGVSGIGSCEVVYLAWVFLRLLALKTSVVVIWGEWRCGMITGFGAFGSWCGNGSCSFFFLDGSFQTGRVFFVKECLLKMFSMCLGFGGA